MLYSGQNQLGPLIVHAASYTVGALVLLVVCKGLAYSIALSSFRGGPTFPAMFVGAAGGIALSHLPGLSLVPGAAVGMAALMVAILRLPMSSVLITTLFLGSDGIGALPLVVVAVVVSFVLSVRLDSQPARAHGQPAAAPVAQEGGPAKPVATQVP